MTGIDGFFKNDFYSIGKIAYSILAGVLGTVLIVLFLTTFMDIYKAARCAPWIMAFAAALTGYSLLDKTRDLLKHKQIAAVGAGILNIIITYSVLSFIFLYLTDEYLFNSWDLTLFLIIGIVFSYLGALLAIRYFKLRRQKPN